MERRNFLKFLAGGAGAALTPSLVWPFRKIFLPAVRPSVSTATLADIERIFRETMHYKQEQIMMDFYLYGMATFSSKPGAQYRIAGIREPFIWTANKEQSAAWHRKFKQYGLV